MARSRAKGLVRYRRNVMPRWFYEGRKVLTDYGGWTLEDYVVIDDYGAKYDPRQNTGDVDYDESNTRVG